MKNKLTDLNDHLFAQMERLSDEDLKGEKLSAEIDRSKSMVSVSGKIIQNATLALNAEKFRSEYHSVNMPKMIGEDKS